MLTITRLEIYLKLVQNSNSDTRNSSKICLMLTIITLDIVEVYNLPCSIKENFNMMRN